MREVIAKRIKRDTFFLSILSVFSLVSSFFNWYAPGFTWISLVGICAFSLSTIFYLAELIDPRAVITMRDNQLYVRHTLLKTSIVDIADIRDATLAQNPQKPEKIEKHAITIFTVINGVDKKIDCYGVVDAPGAIAKIKALIGKE